jgi:hypothetical protein
MLIGRNNANSKNKKQKNSNQMSNFKQAFRLSLEDNMKDTGNSK